MTAVTILSWYVMEWMSKRISFSFCYTELLNIEDSLLLWLATLSVTWTSHKNVQRMEKTCSATAKKKFEKPFSIILQMTYWLWAWADSFPTISIFFFIFGSIITKWLTQTQLFQSSNEDLPYNHINVFIRGAILSATYWLSRATGSQNA